jgi:hypothetical protein
MAEYLQSGFDASEQLGYFVAPMFPQDLFERELSLTVLVRNPVSVEPELFSNRGG